MAAKANSMARSRSGRAGVRVSGVGVRRPRSHRDFSPFPRSDAVAALPRSDFDAGFPLSGPDFGAGFRRPAFAARVRGAVRTMRPSPFQLLSGGAPIPPMGPRMPGGG